MTPQPCPRVALSSPFSAPPVTCGNEQEKLSWGRLCKIHTRIASSPSPWPSALMLSKSWVYLLVLHLLLFPVPLGVEILKKKGSADWLASIKGAVSQGLVTGSGSLRMGGTRQIFHWYTVTLKDNRIWDFPGGPVVKTPCFHCRGCGFNPWSGN